MARPTDVAAVFDRLHAQTITLYEVITMAESGNREADHALRLYAIRLMDQDRFGQASVLLKAYIAKAVLRAPL